MIWVLLLLSLLLLLILMMPARRHDNIVMQNHSEENLRLYQERSDEVKNSDLDDAQKAALQLELDREFLANAGDEHQPGSAQREPKRWPLALAMVAVVLAGTLLFYQFWGASVELKASALLDKAAQVELTEPERKELIGYLKQASDKDPQNGEWFYLYGRMLTIDNQFDEAAKVFADILVTLPEEATEDRAVTLTLLAQAKFFAADQKADQETYNLLKESLDLQPANRQTQGLAGMLAFELQNYRGAIDHWKVVWQSLPDSPEAQMLAQGIQRAADRLQEQREDVDLSWLERVQLKVLVDLSDEARAAAAPDDTVFVLARAASGPPMPLAVQRMTVADLPQVVTLSDAQAMAPGMNISSFDELTLIARISKSGQPQAQPGDWQMLKTPVSNREKERIDLVISELVE